METSNLQPSGFDIISQKEVLFPFNIATYTSLQNHKTIFSVSRSSKDFIRLKLNVLIATMYS